jgi:hypothetical protein
VTSFLEQIQHVADGEPVDASTTSRPTQQLEGNVRNLRDLLELSLLGQAIIVRELAIDPTLSVGQVVYWNSANARCEAAMADVVLDPTLRTLIGTPQSQALGVLYLKEGTTIGDILLNGWVKLDLTAALNGQPLVAGRYFLSGTVPGMLVQARASLSVPILYAAGDGYVQVSPQWRSWAEDHEHFRIELVCLPAGTSIPPAYAQPHVITSPDPSKPGWLPAGHVTFNGKAPPNATFGYNIAAQPELQRLWPPFPPDAATLVWDKGFGRIGGTEVPLGAGGLAIIDRYGIWWLSDCYDDVPWPPTQSYNDGVDAWGPTYRFDNGSLAPGSIYYSEFHVVRPATITQGDPTNADSLPTIELRRNGTAVSTTNPVITVTNISLGRYSVRFVVPLVWRVGDTLQLFADIVLGGAAYRNTIGGVLIVPAEEPGAGAGISEELSEVSESLCARQPNMRLAIEFSRTLFNGDRTLVTSLRAATGSIIRVYGCDQQPASTGDLIVDADLSLTIDGQNTPGFLVLKSIVNNKFEQGPVTEGIVISGSSLLASATNSQTVGGVTVYQGIVTLAIAADPIDRELPPVLTRLKDTKERYENGIVYVGFPAGYQSSVVRVFQVPPAGLTAGTKVEVRITLLGTLSGVLPTLAAWYRRIPRGSLTGQALPGVDTAITLPTMPTIASGSQYVEVVLPQFAVAAGDTLQLLITRTASDGYSGEIGILRTAAVLISPAG